MLHLSISTDSMQVGQFVGKEVANALDGHVRRRIGGEHPGSFANLPWRGNTVVTWSPHTFFVAARMRSLSSTIT
jgi:hypothetical protein